MKLNRVLPNILAFISGHQRYLPDIKWSNESIVHNIFRFYELIFWRRVGIRAESAYWSYVDQSGRQRLDYQLYTFEAICANIETLVRKVFKIDWVKVELLQFDFSFAGFGHGPKIPWISFAIVIDVATNDTFSGTSANTYSATCTGSDLLIAIGTSTKSLTTTPTVVSAVTYNTVGATKARADTKASSTRSVESSVWLLHNPATGAHTVSTTFSGGSTPQQLSGSVSYTGASQTSTADASNGTTGTASSGDKTFVVTTVADNCWVLCAVILSSSSGDASFTADQTQRWNVVRAGSIEAAGGEDTNGPKTPAGGQTMGWTIGGSTGAAQCWSMTGASFAPVAGSALTKNLTDTMSLGDVLSKAAGKILLDSMSMADSSGKTSHRFLIDTMSMTDSLSKLTAKILADSFSISDSIVVSIVLSLTLSDTESISDSMFKSAGIKRSDTIVLADAMISNNVKNIIDTMILTDTIRNSLSKNLTDVMLINDSLMKALGLNKTDVMAITDVLFKSAVKSINEVFTLTDSLSKTIGIPESDTVALSEAIYKTVGLSKSDTVTLVEFLTKSVHISIIDAEAISDSLSRVIRANLTDAMQLTDIISRNLGKTISDQISIIDALNTNFIHIADRIFKVTLDKVKRRGSMYSSKSNIIKAKDDPADNKNDLTHKKLFS